MKCSSFFCYNHLYFAPSEQQLFGRTLGYYLHYFQCQMRCYGCIFKFPNTKIIRENTPCVTLILCRYQVLTFCSISSEKSLKLVSAIFYQILISLRNDSPLKTMKIHTVRFICFYFI